PAYAQPSGYAAQPAYPQQASGYAPQPAYQQPSAYPQQAGGAQASAYAPQGAYPQQPAYAQQQGYAPQSAYAQQPAYGQAAYPQPPAYAQPPAGYGQGGYAPQPADGSYMSTPWPMSPQAAQATEAAQLPRGNPPGAGAGTSARRRAPARTAQSATAGRTARTGQAPRAGGQPVYAQTAYPQQPYAQQPYPQQPYAPQPYAPPLPQNYTNQGYGLVPYVPQPPAPRMQAQNPYAPYPQGGYAQGGYPQDGYPQGGYAQGGAAQPSAPVSQTLTVEEELAEINREQTSTLAGGVQFRNRSGEDGLSDLNDIEAPIEGRIHAGDGHVVVRATPVLLDAGTSDASPNTLARFGSNSINRQTTPSNSQHAAGVGLDIGYEYRGLKIDAGGTPFGFREQNVVGGVQYQGGLSQQVSYKVTASRRAVTDSLLSYAGAHDDASNQNWGGVTSNGLRGDLAWDNGTSGVYVNGEFQYLTGHNVKSNTAGKGGGGVYSRVYKDDDQSVTVGVNTTLMHYANNLSFFTLGQGGYFSPQQYVILNLPLRWMGRDGHFAYNFGGSIGVQHYRQDSSPYYPNNSTLQDQAAGAGISPDPNAVYPSQSKTGVSYSLDAAGEYQLAPQLTVGASASFGNAYEYREFVAGVYVRYAFTKQSAFATTTFPPTPLSSPYLTTNY
ncbi:MAG TPA: cellulose synthase subunit BcsC-related outer membrane protein, partial [Paraburkholderia sp.]|nr:cellulose synthase subunit BcsC-related outer membrane protein [Paraburkholderia sp.]